ncbi:hypothetical protein HDU89_004480 [Geranomyces variabilis]|nr:hypothetical protein HDU89_004480 [Geranomyces variabilis]
MLNVFTPQCGLHFEGLRTVSQGMVAPLSDPALHVLGSDFLYPLIKSGLIEVLVDLGNAMNGERALRHVCSFPATAAVDEVGVQRDQTDILDNRRYGCGRKGAAAGGTAEIATESPAPGDLAAALVLPYKELRAAILEHLISGAILLSIFKETRESPEIDTDLLFSCDPAAWAEDAISALRFVAGKITGESLVQRTLRDNIISLKKRASTPKAKAEFVAAFANLKVRYDIADAAGERAVQHWVDCITLTAEEGVVMEADLGRQLMQFYIGQPAGPVVGGSGVISFFEGEGESRGAWNRLVPMGQDWRELASATNTLIRQQMLVPSGHRGGRLWDRYHLYVEVHELREGEDPERIRHLRDQPAPSPELASNAEETDDLAKAATGQASASDTLAEEVNDIKTAGTDVEGRVRALVRRTKAAEPSLALPPTLA